MKPVRFIPAVFVLVFFFIQGCSGGGSGVTVTTEKARSSTPVSTDYITGKTEALDAVTIIPKVGGRVSHVAVDVGTRVKAGQVLMKIDMSEVEALREQYRAAVDDAEAGIKKAGIDFDTARDNYERAQALYKSGAMSKSDFDNKYAAPYELARIQAEEAAPNRLAQARAALQSVQASLANGEIVSPIDGEVTARYINPGETCSTSKAVFYIADLTGIAVVSYVDERKLSSLKVGQKVSIKVDSLEKMMESEVRTISQTLDPSARGYQVKFQVKNPDPAVRPGMFARVYTGAEAEKRFVIPKTALVNENGAYSVFVYSGGMVSRVPVKVDRVSDKYVVVGGGIDEGQDIVVYSTAPLQDSTPVRVK